MQTAGSGRGPRGCSPQGLGFEAGRAFRTPGPALRPRGGTPQGQREGRREGSPRAQALQASEGPGASRLRLCDGRFPAGGRVAAPARGPPRGGAGDPGSTRRPRDTGPAASKVQPTSPGLRLCGSVRGSVARARPCRSAHFSLQPPGRRLRPAVFGSLRPPAPCNPGAALPPLGLEDRWALRCARPK